MSSVKKVFVAIIFNSGDVVSNVNVSLHSEHESIASRSKEVFQASQFSALDSSTH